MSNETGVSPKSRGLRPTISIRRLALKCSSKKFRDSYMRQQLRAFLATQIRSLRNMDSQAAFGKRIGKPQSVVSRLEDEVYGNVNVRTLIDIAQKLDLGLIVRFVDFATFLKATADYTDAAIKPAAYTQEAMDELFSDTEKVAAVSKEPDTP